MPLQDADVNEITSRLDVIIKLMAALFAKDFNNVEAIVKLDKMKLSREQIANALGITTANVAQQLYMVGKRVEKKADRKPTKNGGETTMPEATAEAAAIPMKEA